MLKGPSSVYRNNLDLTQSLGYKSGIQIQRCFKLYGAGEISQIALNTLRPMQQSLNRAQLPTAGSPNFFQFPESEVHWFEFVTRSLSTDQTS